MNTVAYSNNALVAGNCTVNYDWWRQWTPVYHYQTSYQPSKIEQAFKIVGKLMEKKYIKGSIEVPDFIKLVNEIAEII